VDDASPLFHFRWKASLQFKLDGFRNRQRPLSGDMQIKSSGLNHEDFLAPASTL
jgi:hypothetical protein